MELYAAMAVIALLVGLWNLTIGILGCFPRFRSTAVGALTDVRVRRNVPSRYGTPIPIVTRYKYIYSVNGRTYKYSGEELRSRRQLFPRVTMVYVKWFPRRAYPNRFTGTTEWTMAAVMLVMAFLLVFTITGHI